MADSVFPVLTVDYSRLCNVLMAIHSGPIDDSATESFREERDATLRCLSHLLVDEGRDHDARHAAFHRMQAMMEADEPAGAIAIEILSRFGTRADSVSESA